MAKFIVNARKKYLARMSRSYQLEVDEADVERDVVSLGYVLEHLHHQVQWLAI
jgi:capsular polysaccharide biosynthesis protein